jgi:hypothetical protein
VFDDRRVGVTVEQPQPAQALPGFELVVAVADAPGQP